MLLARTHGRKGLLVQPKRIVYFDLLTIFACFAVVCLHCNSLVHSFQPGIHWNFALAVEVLFFWAVPVFFMLTGANNINYRNKYDTKTFLKRRLRKLVIPFVFWSLAIYLLDFFIYPIYIGSSPAVSFGEFLTMFFSGNIQAIYWFFPAIISLTIAMPVLSLLTNHRSTMWYVVGMTFILVSICPYLFEWLDLPWDGAYNIPVAGGYVAYALLGHLLATADISKKHRTAIYAAAIGCLALRYGFTFHWSYLSGVTERALFNYTAFTAVFPSIAIFLLFKNHDWNEKITQNANVIAKISGLSFGIYLIHMVILKYVFIKFLDFSWASIAIQVVCPFAVYGLSAVFVYLIKKVPILKELVP